LKNLYESLINGLLAIDFLLGLLYPAIELGKTGIIIPSFITFFAFVFSLKQAPWVLLARQDLQN